MSHTPGRREVAKLWIVLYDMNRSKKDTLIVIIDSIAVDSGAQTFNSPSLAITFRSALMLSVFCLLFGDCESARANSQTRYLECLDASAEGLIICFITSGKSRQSNEERTLSINFGEWRFNFEVE
jgi:hypothetical protein